MQSLLSYYTVDSATSEEIESSLPGQMGVMATKRRCFGAWIVEWSSATRLLTHSFTAFPALPRKRRKVSLADDSLDYEGFELARLSAPEENGEDLEALQTLVLDCVRHAQNGRKGTRSKRDYKRHDFQEQEMPYSP